MGNPRLCGLRMQYLTFPDPVIAIVGPTAVGKTKIAVELAEAIEGEIISADSRLFYRGMDIGTAKPSMAERRGIPHHLIDVTEPNEIWSLADFQQAAYATISEIHGRHKLPILVGGTGQYFRAVVEGWGLPKLPPDEGLRNEIEKWATLVGPYGLHERLAVLDPQAARVIDARNVRRTVRALEVIFRTGLRFSEQRRQGVRPYSLFIIGLKRSRQELYRRIDERISHMLEDGLLEETQKLIENGYAATLPSMSAIGYAEMCGILEGRMDMAEAELLMKRRTRNFVRRQANWFRETDPTIHWLDAAEINVEKIIQLLNNPAGWLAKGFIVTDEEKTDETVA